MRAVIQRVSQASVSVKERRIGAIDNGMVVLLGVGQEDTEKDAVYLAEKIVNLRIYEDDAGVMNRSLLDIGGAALIVSQFTLYGDCRKGRRPSYSKAALPARANELYEYFIGQMRQAGITVATGEFQAMMRVELINDGPVTILLDSSRLF